MRPRPATAPSHGPAGRRAPPGLAARAAATAALRRTIEDGEPPDTIIEAADGPFAVLEARDRALARAILGTALRRHGQIRDALARFMKGRPPKRSGPLAAILDIAAAQILFMDVPDHAAVSLAVTQAGADRDAQHFRPLANAVLRRLAEAKEETRAGQDETALAAPAWLAKRWRAAYGAETAAAIARAHLVEPALDLSVKADPEGWAARLGGIVLPTGSVRLVAHGPIEALDGYADGAWWVQDAAAALPARLIGAAPGQTVADLCAAPGGKTAALAAAGARVTAVDVSPARLDRLRANLARLRLEADVVAADIETWRPDRLFDAVLLDAPCTATGTIRRHPDVALLKRADDVAALAALQARLIDAAVALLAPGGTLVYCTCSLEPEEGEAQARAALGRLPLALVPVEPGEIGDRPELIRDGFLRTLPAHLPQADARLGGLDGFFAARFRRL
ncbi:RsmB/NOP family class I SAM-dependent RNA methyltransferase [Prosthecomicrobium pneumaticum]|uniref:16S rRNA (Cytosine967-C5)-methyltransferase n=1 Tax=Prosthecomicrobium pneumaticum TaxID=81895 RepID=A0A7W9FMP3_9HYPH|nr:RsmB/NOP family class I SAM-dependent RNA methyltransferase [Prosthecomicrobium pneumaticum]MBB5753479.1 16S rRNA (cytosine967-C5)-methyltransferase [Prosthecomicrobium pneumaticum]